MTAHVKNNGGEDTYSIASGNATWTSGTLWIYWVDGQTALSSTTDFPTAMGTDRVVLATYKGGENLVVGEVQVSGHQVDFLKADKLLAESVLAQRIYMGGQTGARLELDGSIPRIDVFSDAVAGVMVRLGRLGTGNDGIVINDSNGDDVMRVDSSGIARFDGVYIQDLTVGRVKASDFAFTANAVDANSGQVFRDEIGYPSPFNEAHEGMSATVEVSSARGTMIWGSAIITVNLQDPDPFIDSSVIRLELRRGGTLLRSWDMEDLPGFVRTDQAGNHRLDGIDVPVDFAVVDPTPGTGNQTYRYLMRFNISAGLVLGEYYVEIVQGDLSVLSAFK